MTGKVSPTPRVLIEVREEHRRAREEMERLRADVTGELRAVGAVLVDVRDLLKERLDLRDEVRDHERRITALERHTG